MARCAGWIMRVTLPLALLVATPTLAQDAPSRPGAPRAERQDPPPRAERPDPPPSRGDPADDGDRPRGPRRATDPNYDPPLRFEVIIYQVEIPPDKVAAIDTQALATQGDTMPDFDKALRALGPTSILYRADQTITLQGRNRIQIGGDVPIVVGATVTPAGQMQNQVSRQRFGAEIDVSGRWLPADGPFRPQGSVTIELTDASPGIVDVGGGVKAPVFRSLRQNYGGELELGKPIVLLSVDGAGTVEARRSVAYVTRLMFRPPTETPR